MVGEVILSNFTLLKDIIGQKCASVQHTSYVQVLVNWSINIVLHSVSEEWTEKQIAKCCYTQYCYLYMPQARNVVVWNFVVVFFINSGKMQSMSFQYGF